MDEKVEPSQAVSLAAIQTVSNNVQQFLSIADVAKAYGEPIEKDGVTIIPTAEVLSAMGFGNGSGGDSTSSGGGGGGGGHTFSRPVAVVIISAESVRVEPVVDVTKVALAFFTALGFILATLVKMTRPPKISG